MKEYVLATKKPMKQKSEKLVCLEWLHVYVCVCVCVNAQKTNTATNKTPEKPQSLR